MKTKPKIEKSVLRTSVPKKCDFVSCDDAVGVSKGFV